MAYLFMLMLVLFVLPLANGWSFAIPQLPSECTPFNISFSGGVPPYEFTFLRLASLDATLPFAEWGNGTALSMNATSSPAEWLLPWRAGDFFLVVGSDATGFGTGGTSQVISMSASSTADSGACLEDSTNSTYLDHVLSWSGGVSQCAYMTTMLTGVQSPVSVAVIVVGGIAGESFRGDNSALVAVNSSTDAAGVLLAWYMNVAAGDDVAFYVEDANGPLFVSPLMTVQPGSLACLDGTVTSSEALGTTAATAEATGTAVESTATGPIEATGTADTVTGSAAPTVAAGSGSQGTTSSATSSSSGPNIGAIVGGVLGGLAGIIAIVALVMFLMHHYNRNQRLLRRRMYGIAAYGRSQPSPPTPRSLEGEVRLKEMGTEGKESVL